MTTRYAPRTARLAGYAELRTRGLTITEACVRLGVCRRTGERYEASLTASGQAPWRTPAVVQPLPAVTVITAHASRGTFLGALLHRVRNEEPCPACAAAETRLRMRQAWRDQTARRAA